MARRDISQPVLSMLELYKQFRTRERLNNVSQSLGFVQASRTISPTHAALANSGLAAVASALDDAAGALALTVVGVGEGSPA